jgi:hypothetical protein
LLGAATLRSGTPAAVYLATPRCAQPVLASGDAIAVDRHRPPGLGIFGLLRSREYGELGGAAATDAGTLAVRIPRRRE